MATVLEQYLAMETAAKQKIAARSFATGGLMALQELQYRICVIETLKCFCLCTPEQPTPDGLCMHYRAVGTYLRFLVSERRMGSEADGEANKRRETARTALVRVVEDSERRWSSYQVTTAEKYRKDITDTVNTVLPVWIQYRNTVLPIGGERA